MHPTRPSPSSRTLSPSAWPLWAPHALELFGEQLVEPSHPDAAPNSRREPIFELVIAELSGAVHRALTGTAAVRPRSELHRPHLRGSDRGYCYLTVRVPSIPAWRWPGTEQKYVYVP